MKTHGLVRCVREARSLRVRYLSANKPIMLLVLRIMAQCHLASRMIYMPRKPPCS